MKVPCKSDLQIEMEKLAQGSGSRWGLRSVQYAGALRALAKIQWRDGFPEDAERNLTAAISIFDDHRETRAQDALQSRSELGLVFESMGRNAEALPLLELAISSFESLDVSLSPLVFRAMGMVYFSEERYEEAIDCFTQANAWFREDFGNSFWRVIEIEAAIGRAYRRLKDYSSAEKHLLKSLDARRAARCEGGHDAGTGALDDDATDLMYEIAELHLDFEERSKCASFLEDCVQEISRELGDDHYAASRFCHLLGIVREQQGDFDAAEDAFKSALAIRMESVGEDQRRAASNSAFALGGMYHDLGRFEEAERVLLWAYTARPRSGGFDRRLAEIQGYLGSTLRQLGQDALAVPFLQSALEMFTAIDGEESTAVACCKRDLDAIHGSSGDPDASR
jgi:tetratricopeptide (TPR) repeat protein